MDESFFDFLDHSDELCDCCGATCDDHVLYTIEVACEVTLCRECVCRFYALLDRNAKSVRTFKVLKGLNDE